MPELCPSTSKTAGMKASVRCSLLTLQAEPHSLFAICPEYSAHTLLHNPNAGMLFIITVHGSSHPLPLTVAKCTIRHCCLTASSVTDLSIC